MASSLFVNTLQVEFESVLSMEHTGMTSMFKSLEDTGLKGFMEGSTSVYENVLVLNSAWDNVSARMNTFDEWLHFRKELEVQKLYTEHLANFKLDVPSVNHDYLCIRFLKKELKEIATLHRAQRVIAGLPIVAPEASFIGLASDQSQFLTLEFSSRTEQEQAATQEPTQQVVQPDNANEAVNSQEHQAHENEPPVPTEEPQALNNEHRSHAKDLSIQELILKSVYNRDKSSMISIKSKSDQKEQFYIQEPDREPAEQMTM
ncbi:hypothetical protein F511_07256 [Dorcoceras hygrometricum]|uniref:Uncharacterized protein n=1 Tax=Dorcoceras hygrometricum TaxID=472368 RepID=A0A2Z7B1J0_9LAMI|nr:hypothetical protein F511_07256 [Dorcoceras hygrometricum]